MFNISTILTYGVIMLISLPLHEFAHGYAAYKLGDPTAKNMGRLTLNPLAHLDPIGSLCMLIMGVGWAKGVPVNPMYFKNPKRDMALTALAGPTMNVLLSFVSMVVLKLLIVVGVIASPTNFLYTLLQNMVVINISLAVFNLIPIPPLDGSKILNAVLPERIYFKIQEYEQYMMIGLILILRFTNLLDGVILGAGKFMFHLFDQLTRFIY